MDYYSLTDPEGMEGWVVLVGWPTADTLPTKWSRVNHRSGKVRQLKTRLSIHRATPPTLIFLWSTAFRLRSYF